MRAVIALIALVLALVARDAHAQNSACRIRTVGLDFGVYSPLATTPDVAVGTIILSCTPPGLGDIARVTLSPGRSGRFLDRTLTQGGEPLRYNLYAEPSHIRIVGDGSNGTVRPAAIRGRGNSIYRLYGLIPPGQAVSAGEYSDTMRVVVEF